MARALVTDDQAAFVIKGIALEFLNAGEGGSYGNSYKIQHFCANQNNTLNVNDKLADTMACVLVSDDQAAFVIGDIALKFQNAGEEGGYGKSRERAQ